ncbi:MAG: phage portal protein [Phycisphaerales bacterium]
MKMTRAIAAFVERAFGVRPPTRPSGFGGPGSLGGVHGFTVFDGDGRPIVGYDAGRVTRLDADFLPPAMGPNAAADQYLDLAWRRISHQVDNNPLLCGARDIWRRNTVGRGLYFEPNTPSKSLNKKLRELFWRMSELVDPSREHDLAEMQGRFINQLFRGGEDLVHLPVVPAWRGQPMGVAIELIDTPEMMPLSIAGTVSGNQVRHGVEFDRYGRRVAYHVLKERPNDGWGWNFSGAALPGSTAVRRIDARDAVLAFVEKRRGQVRGVPWPVATLTTLRLEDSFKEAEILLAKARACLGLAIKGTTAARVNPASAAGLVDADGRPITELAPGMVAYLPPGAELATIFPTTPGGTLNSTVELLQRLVAAGLGLGYGTLTRDRSKSTFSADRADKIEDRAGFAEVQNQLIWGKLTRPWWERTVDVALAGGLLTLDLKEQQAIAGDPRLIYRVTVVAEGMEYVNPKDESYADDTALKGGFTNLAIVCGRRGQSWQDMLDQRLVEEQYESEKRREMGLPPRAGAPAASPAPADQAGSDESDPEELEPSKQETRP